MGLAYRAKTTALHSTLYSLFHITLLVPAIDAALKQVMNVLFLQVVRSGRRLPFFLFGRSDPFFLGA
jgi:hypothetical protein